MCHIFFPFRACPRRILLIVSVVVPGTFGSSLEATSLFCITIVVTALVESFSGAVTGTAICDGFYLMVVFVVPRLCLVWLDICSLVLFAGDGVKVGRCASSTLQLVFGKCRTGFCFVRIASFAMLAQARLNASIPSLVNVIFSKTPFSRK
jgi:hypothetical protein